MTVKIILMYAIGLFLIYLAIKKKMEPALLLPIGFGAILVNLPGSGVINQTIQGVGKVHGIIQWLYEVGIETSEALPILLFIGIGAMIDFTPLLQRPVLFIFGFAAQVGIFVAIGIALLCGFDLKDAASIGMIGAAGISAFPMSSRVVQTMAQTECPGNVILMQAVGANVAGQIGSVVVGGLILGLF